jgi:hypothetical protein
MLEATPFVNSTSQGMLAKLLAKENITVEVGNYSTAFFDVKNRILGLPTWNVTNKAVSDLLVGHEVGHALYTPDEGITKFKEVLPNCPFDVLNIVEDIRIEKMVQDQYPGLISSFTAGYAHFIEKDFFKIKGIDIPSMPFIERLNLRGKIGNQMDIPLDVAEEMIYRRCLATESIDDVIEVCRDIYEMVKEELKKQKQQEPNPENEDSSSEQSPSQPDSGEDSSSEQSPSQPDSGDGEEKEVDSEDLGNSKKDEDGEEDSTDSLKQKTKNSDEKPDDSQKVKSKGSESEDKNEDPSDQELNDALQSKTLGNLNDELTGMQQTFTDHNAVMAPSKQQMLDSIIPVSKVMEERKSSKDYNYYFTLPSVVEDWKQFKSSTKQHVNLLVKEFERKKAAFQYSRAQRSMTGSIDVNRLHSYKFEDQIFKSVTKLADAKNHGMIFFIDYSGSMGYDIPNVINHTLNLIFFCKAVSIPFEVYGFTTPSHNSYASHANTNCKQISVAYCQVIELMNSSMKKNEFDLACRQMRAQAFLANSPENGYGSNFAPITSSFEYLGGTPLFETIIIAHELIKRFKQKHHVQKMNAIFLTDGDGRGLHLGTDTATQKYQKENIREINRLPFRTRISGRQVDLYHDHPSQNYAALVENLRITCDVTAIGFFITTSRSQIKTSAINALRHPKGAEIKDWVPASEKVAQMMPQLRKNKCLFIPNGFAFDEYFIISGGELVLDDEDSFTDKVEADMTTIGGQNKLAKAFTKYTSDKRSSRLILNKFVALVA